MKEADIKKGSRLISERDNKKEILKQFKMDEGNIINIAFMGNEMKPINHTGPHSTVVRFMIDQYAAYLELEIVKLTDEISAL